MEDLPLELRIQICQSLSHADLKHSRCTKPLYPAASKLLFRTFSLYPIKESFDLLTFLAESEFASSIKCLRYRRIPLPAFKSAADWTQVDLWQRPPSPKDVACNHFSAQHAEWTFKIYQSRAAVEECKIGYHDSEQLQRALARLPGLTTFEMPDVDMNMYRHPLPNREPFRTAYKLSLVNISLQGMKILNEMAVARPNLEEVSLQKITWRMLQEIELDTLVRLRQRFKAVKTFTVSMPHKDHDEAIILMGGTYRLSPLWERIKLILTAPLDPVTFDVSSNGGIASIADGYFDISALSTVWSRLRDLRIAGFHMKGGEFLTFLLLHTGTLETLELRNISLFPDDSGTLSWITVIKTLQARFTLKNIKFQGGLLNGEHVGWEVFDEEMVEGQHYLRARVEQYCVQGGEFPLPLDMQDDMSEEELVGLQKTLRGDASWKYSNDFYGVMPRTW